MQSSCLPCSFRDPRIEGFHLQHVGFKIALEITSLYPARRGKTPEESRVENLYGTSKETDIMSTHIPVAISNCGKSVKQSQQGNYSPGTISILERKHELLDYGQSSLTHISDFIVHTGELSLKDIQQHVKVLDVLVHRQASLKFSKLKPIRHIWLITCFY